MADDASVNVRAPKSDDLPSVEAELLYLTPSPEKPYVLAYPPGDDGQPMANTEYESHRVRIHDARPLGAGPTLDREGFAYARHRSAVTDFYDEAQLDTVAHDEAAELIRQVTGAARVVVFDHTFRRNTPDVPDRTPGTPRQPVTRVHNDYTLKSGPQRVRDLLGDEAETLLKGRYAFINVWRPTRGPVLDTPLAVCDARSARFEDFVATDLIYQDRVGEIYNVHFNPAHQWFYYPRMTTDEAILIKCFDSDTSVSRFSPHVAFSDPTTPPDAPPRESLEIRTAAFFS